MYNLLFCSHTISMDLTKEKRLVSCSDRTIHLHALWFVQKRPKMEQKHTTNTFPGIGNHLYQPG